MFQCQARNAMHCKSLPPPARGPALAALQTAAPHVPSSGRCARSASKTCILGLHLLTAVLCGAIAVRMSGGERLRRDPAARGGRREPRVADGASGDTLLRGPGDRVSGERAAEPGAAGRRRRCDCEASKPNQHRGSLGAVPTPRFANSCDDSKLTSCASGPTGVLREAVADGSLSTLPLECAALLSRSGKESADDKAAGLQQCRVYVEESLDE